MAWVEQRGTRWRVRYRTADGTVGTDSSHPIRAATELRAKQVDIDQATDSYLDPTGGHATLAEWVAIWAEGHDVGPAKAAAYGSHLNIHILPRFGNLPLTRIDRHSVKIFVKHLKTQLADSSVTSVMALFSLIMREAVADRRIGHDPCHGVRVTTRRAPERPHATATQINRIIERIPRFDHRVLVLTAAYTGMRWGELVGLARRNVDLAGGIIHIDPDEGSLHELAGTVYLGPPKTTDSARAVHLPPFLTHLLHDVLTSHTHEIVFTAAMGGYLRRSNFNRRTWTPAAAGNPDRNLPAIVAGMHFHDLRHTHKVWLIEDGIPEIVQAKRLGHHMPGVRGIYSHVSPAMTQQLIDALQQRWTRHQPPAAAQSPTRHLRAA